MNRIHPRKIHFTVASKNSIIVLQPRYFYPKFPTRIHFQNQRIRKEISHHNPYTEEFEFLAL